MISSCSVNIGEASVERTETYYPFIQKLNYLKFSKAAKERSSFASFYHFIIFSFYHFIILLFYHFYSFYHFSFLREFEGYLDDFQDLSKDISTCYNVDGTVKPNNTQGEIAQSLLAKKVHNKFISLHCALNSFPSLIPRYLSSFLNYS